MIQSIKPKRDEMTALIQQAVGAVERREDIPFSQSCGRVCAADVFSRNTLPNRPVSRFDGIGVRFDDFAGGMPDTRQWREGREYVFCNTGIAIPDGFDTVIAIEDVEVLEQGIALHAVPKARGEMVNPVGCNLRTGEPLARRGDVLVPAHVGLFAAGGVETVPVYARPRVAVLPTGDELVPPTDQVPPGKNVESNSYMIAAYLEQWGAEAVCLPIAADSLEGIADTLQKALEQCDAAIIIAGSSLGTKDFTIRVLDRLGQVLAPELAHGPGRKSSLSVVGGKPVLGVAGPPMGAQITCDLYLAPFVAALRGVPYVRLQQLEVTCDDPFAAHPVDFCERVHIYRGQDGYHIRSAFAPETTRAQMQAIANGNFYRPANTACAVGGKTAVELLCPIEAVPDRDLLPDILGERGDRA